MPESEKIETPSALYYINNNILFMRGKLDAEINLDEAIAGVEARKKLQQGKKMLVLIDTTDVYQTSKEARDYGAKKEVTDLSIAMAILAGNSLASIIIGNFFIKSNNPSIPTKLFKSETKALEWLKTFK
jgi:hypothetical protein